MKGTHYFYSFQKTIVYSTIFKGEIGCLLRKKQQEITQIKIKEE